MEVLASILMAWEGEGGGGKGRGPGDPQSPAELVHQPAPQIHLQEYLQILEDSVWIPGDFLR